MTDEKVQEDKPAVTFKDENAVTDKTKTMTDEKVPRGQTSCYIQR